MMRADQGFAVFWEEYRRQHQNKAVRQWHVWAGGIAMLALAAGIMTVRLWDVGMAIVAYYALAGFSHWRIAPSRPASFHHPIWAIRARWHLLAHALAVGVGEELPPYAQLKTPWARRKS
ncbi:MAG: DUF962 domain-containing protein [Firmicutes bacterium]|nr:DUF962 domain-containing protein [Bacillota bacterium]